AVITDLQLVNPIGGPGSLTASDSSVSGRLEDPESVSYRDVEIDRDGDGVVDATVQTDGDGVFVYRADGLEYGSVTLNFRGRSWDNATASYQPGEWATFTFTYTAPVVTGPAITELALASDSGPSAYDNATANPSLAGRVAGDGPF